jgi:hypothetical protein
MQKTPIPIQLLYLLLICPLVNIAQPTNGLIAYFNFNSSLTNNGSASITANTYNTNYTTNNPNIAGQSIQYTGNLNSYTEFTDNGNLDFTGSTNFTISFGFLFSGTANGGIIDNCLNYGGWGLYVWSTVSGVWNLQFNYKNNSVGSAAATAITPNTWQHITAVRNNGTISIYINGIHKLSATEGTTTQSYPINPITGALSWSGFTPPRYNPLNGKLDELRIYNRALSNIEIASLTPYALPLKLGSFTAINKNDKNELVWETISEQNAAFFEVEKSTNNIDWTSIGTVAAKGNSTTKSLYSFVDNSTQLSTEFYRLKLVDKDGSYTYSNQIAVKHKWGKMSLELFPNPATNLVQVNVKMVASEQVLLQIVNTEGKLMRSQIWQVKEGSNMINLPIGDLPAGYYFIKASSIHLNQSKLLFKK